MVTDTTAAERMVDRLLAVKWDDDVAYERRRSRARLASEFLRRTAQWALAVGATDRWPFGDLAGAVDPAVAVDPALLTRLALDAATAGEFPVRPTDAAVIVRWAALGDLPRQRFPELADPYEPLLVMFGRGGAYTVANGAIELGYGTLPILSVAERASLAPQPIDAAALDALDREG